MNKKDPGRIFDEISNERVRMDLDLLPGIREKLQHGTQPMVKPFFSLRFVVLVLVIAGLALGFTFPGVASAVQKMIGYLPGLGIVELDANLRVLAQPVTGTRDGYTITVERALFDPTHTVLEYRITGAFARWADPTLEPQMCSDRPFLRLPDGQALMMDRSEGGLNGTAATLKEIYPAVPPGETQVMLVLPCLSNLPSGIGPKQWEILLTLAPAPPDLTVYPLVELTGQVAAVTPESDRTEMPAINPADPFTLVLERAAVLDDSYFLQTALTWTAGVNFSEVQTFPDAVHLYDAEDREVSIWPNDQASSIASAHAQRLELNYQTGSVQPSEQLKLVVDYVWLSLPAHIRFTLDLGPDPKPGQIWPINQELEAAGRRLRVLSAEYVQPEPGQPSWLMLALESPDGDIMAAIAGDPEHVILGTGGSPAGAQVPFRAGWRYPGAVPSGEITVEINSVTVRHNGPWSLTWSPELPLRTTPPSESTSSRCGPAYAAQATSGDLPPDVTGRLAISGEGFQALILPLDGSKPLSLDYAMMPDLSPDGLQLVYRGTDEGLHISDLNSGAERMIPGTIVPGFLHTYPRWSPSGDLIAFNLTDGYTSDIYLVKDDGSGLRVLLNGPESEQFLSWSPDGKMITYLIRSDQGVSLRVLILESGKSYEASQLPAGAVEVRPSPDGRQILFRFGESWFLIRAPSTTLEPLIPASETIYNPVWSPDSQWVALTDSTEDGFPLLTLLNPETCQFARWSHPLNGVLTSWSR